MKTYTVRLSAFLSLCLAVCVFLGPTAVAEEPGRDLDDLAKRFSKQIEKAGIGSIGVADFVGQDGTDSIQGRYLADEFAQRLEHYKKKFVLIGRKWLSAALSDAQLSAKDLAAPDSLRRIGDSLQVEAVVTGTLETTSAQYSVNVTVRRVKDGGEIATGNLTINRPAYVDSLAFLDPGVGGSKIGRPGVDGVGVPICKVCPVPEDTDEAKAAKIRSHVMLLAVISEEGRAVKITVTKASGDEIAARAAEAVRKWEFKPATDKNGNAVAVLIPIEVTFRLY
jgi:TonB family protein